MGNKDDLPSSTGWVLGVSIVGVAKGVGKKDDTHLIDAGSSSIASEQCSMVLCAW